MQYLLERFPIMTCAETTFKVALRRLSLREERTEYEVLSSGILGGRHAEVVVSAVMFPANLNFKVHPLLQFLKSNHVISRKSMFLNLPEPVEFIFGTVAGIHTKVDEPAIFDVVGELVPFPTTLWADKEEFSAASMDGCPVIRPKNFYLSEDML